MGFSGSRIRKLSKSSVGFRIFWVFLHTLPVVLPSKIGFFSWLVLIIFKANKNIRTQISNNPARVPPIIGPNWDKDTGWFLKTFSKSIWSDWLHSLIPNRFCALKLIIKVTFVVLIGVKLMQCRIALVYMTYFSKAL